jgi:hypothetical protein
MCIFTSVTCSSRLRNGNSEMLLHGLAKLAKSALMNNREAAAPIAYVL